MTSTAIRRQIFVTTLLMIVSVPVNLLASTQSKDTLSQHVLNEVRKYFNSDNEERSILLPSDTGSTIFRTATSICTSKDGCTRCCMT